MRIFLDANVLFSAANAESPIHLFLSYLKGRSALITSAYAEMEAARNIALKRPHWQPGLAKVMKQVTVVADRPLSDPVRLHDKDRPVLGAAIAARCDYLLTGDKRDFGHLYGKTIGGVEIVSYRMLTQRMG